MPPDGGRERRLRVGGPAMFLISHWSAPPGVLIPVVITGAVHRRGASAMGLGRRSQGLRGRQPQRRREARSFYAGLVAVVLALASPVDYWSQVDFWPHMLQHLVLIYVAAPLIVLGAPWLPLLRGLPATPRRALLRLVYRRRAGAWLRSGLRALAHPVVATAGFLSAFLAWHLRGPFDLALTDRFVHDFEHACFLAIGIWLWSQLVGSYPYRPRWEPLSRVWLVATVLFVNWMIAIAMTFARTPWYPAYAHVGVRHMALLPDQSLAGACMWVLPMIPLGIVTFACLNAWLAHDDPDDEDRLQDMIARTRAAMLAPGGQH
ncbi:MAG: cytochrome c oxidase assembly protein [Acidimicrobiales bacterium]